MEFESLKVPCPLPMCEIFDRSVIHDFYILKSLGLKINFYFLFKGSFMAAKFHDARFFSNTETKQNSLD